MLEGRLQIGGRSFRLLGIEPVTLPSEVGNAPAIGRAGLQSFVTPPGEMLVSPETLSSLGVPEGSAPQANGSGATKNQEASMSELALDSSWPVGWRWCQESGRRRYCRVTRRR